MASQRWRPWAWLGPCTTSVHTCWIIHALFTLTTPHCCLHNTPKANYMVNWSASIAELVVEIKYRPGRRNANVDTLSQAPVGAPPSQNGRLDPCCWRIRTFPPWIVYSNSKQRGTTVTDWPSWSLHLQLMQEAHSGSFPGHFTPRTVYEKLAWRFW